MKLNDMNLSLNSLSLTANSAVPHAMIDYIQWRRRSNRRGVDGIEVRTTELVGMVMVYDSQYTCDACATRRNRSKAREPRPGGTRTTSTTARAREREGERERVSKRASEQAAERASERASERDRVAQGRWSESGTLSRRAAAAGLAPDVKFSCGKAQLYFTV